MKKHLLYLEFFILGVLIIAFLAGSALMIQGCEALPDKPGLPYNPLDPANPDYEKPVAIITSGPDSGSVINTDEVTFMWSGNHDNMLFRTNLDTQGWTSFSEKSSVTYSNLDEFGHLFSVQARYPSGDMGEEISIPFVVDALDGPALFLRPRNMHISAGVQFSLELWVDETAPIAGINTEIIFNPDQIRVNNIDFVEQNNESFLLMNGGQLISFSDTDNINGIVALNCAVTEGSPRNVTGSGIIARMTFEHISGSEISVSISEQSILRNSQNQQVNLKNYMGTMISLLEN